MTGWLADFQPWVRAAHLILVIFWMAGLFMLPRHLAYQAEEAPGSAADRSWSQRIARLRRIILTPALVGVWLTGLAVAANLGFAAGWIHAKIVLVLLLSGFHGWMVAVSRRMALGARPLSTRALRLWNEAPAVAAIVIVLLAVLRPF